VIPELVPLFVCPQCSSHAMHHEVFDQDGRGCTVDGLLWCGRCRSWYPIASGVLELLPDHLAYHEDRAQFRARHAHALDRLALKDEHRQPPLHDGSGASKQQRHFDWYAQNASQTYDAYARTPFWQAVDRTIFREWRQHISPRTWLLDVGCAQGRSSAPFMDFDLTLVGFDVSKTLVRQAQRRYAGSTDAARAVFFVGNASQFPFVDGSFDYVLVYGVLHHLENPAHACGEIARVLKPGGTYFGLENNTTILRPLFDLLQRLLPLWHEEAGARALISASELVSWFGEAGMTAAARSTVFLPPHVANRLSSRAAQQSLQALDAVFGKVPFVRNQGGLLVATGRKPASSV
jgi:ubiquinone/menaquinone biosynthesis C-methylase UbiE/uncharacterized protein YbaR (Trm112 family)